jgi:hypothetical protein
MTNGVLKIIFFCPLTTEKVFEKPLLSLPCRWYSEIDQAVPDF